MRRDVVNYFYSRVPTNMKRKKEEEEEIDEHDYVEGTSFFLI